MPVRWGRDFLEFLVKTKSQTKYAKFVIMIRPLIARSSGVLALVSGLACGSVFADPAAEFEKEILPILEARCFDCHGDGAKKGSVSFDASESTEALLAKSELWVHVLKNIRSGLMPPAKEPRLEAAEISRLQDWIKRGALKLDPHHPDPGRVTLRRLNRIEYHHTIQDLMGIDFRTDEEFPADDTGYGFDTIGDVLTTSPLLLEKYMQAAETIVAQAMPLESAGKAHPPSDDRFFTRREVPLEVAGRRDYAQEILRRFATRAFRRPVDEATVTRLAGLAEDSAAFAGGTFEKGIARAMTAVLASPRFLFRMEDTLPLADPLGHPLLDEYALACRLSYFLWSTMPDPALFDLASRGELRKNLHAQVQRMLADTRSDELVKNFAGQWLQTRDVESVSIDARIVLARDSGQEDEMRKRFVRRQQLNQEIDSAEKAHDEARVIALHGQLEQFRKQSNGKGPEFSADLRTAMRLEAEMWFRHLLRDDRSLLELIETDETYLNQLLAEHYGVPHVNGGEMRLVKLPPNSPRGGIITMGSVLAVTSNATRTSPVKRGLFILDNLLGTPPPPPPPDIPSLEASAKGHDGQELSLRQALALHREKPLCASCHDRMDPLGLALENFNAMGQWRDKESGQTIPPAAGKLITGETFTDVRELKHLLVTSRREDYYRCITEKLMTYAIGRGPQPCDIQTVDEIVVKLDSAGGKFSALLMGIIESPAFQQRHRETP